MTASVDWWSEVAEAKGGGHSNRKLLVAQRKQDPPDLDALLPPAAGSDELGCDA